MDVVTVLAAAAITWRATRLVTKDTLTDPIRKRFKKTRLGEFLSCPACVGFWLAILTYCLAPIAPQATLIAGAACAANLLYIWFHAATAFTTGYLNSFLACAASITGADIHTGGDSDD